MKEIMLITYCSIAALFAHSQDTVWISQYNKILPSRDSAISFEIWTKNEPDTNAVQVIRKGLDGSIQSERNFQPFYPKRIFNGIYKNYSNGLLADERTYKNDKLHGVHITYWENGKVKRRDVYADGEFISGNCYGFNGADTTWFSYEIYASFPGGTDSLRRFIAKNLTYPNNAKLDGIEGTVKVKFIITKDGSVSDVQVMNHINSSLESEATRLVNLMPKWIPGKIDGILVNMYFILPVTFKLNE